MKVGIVTVYRNINYGSVLQSYALQSILRSLGVQPENVLVYRDLESRSFRWYLSQFKQMLLGLLPSSYSKRTTNLLSKKFKQFRSEFIIEGRYSPSQISKRIANNRNDYDAFICGSDQIWAPNQFKDIYFLSFVKDDVLKVSYATSIGLPMIPEHLKEVYKCLINRLDSVSMRESEGADLVAYVTGRKNISVVLDPTLLLNRLKWKEISRSHIIPDKYILCLFLGNDMEQRKWCLKLSEKTGCKIVTLPLRTWDYTFGDYQYFDAGPQEFLYLVENSEYVCTDSFHGMAFSINYNKLFYAFLRFSDNDPLCQNSRVHHLLNLFDLKERLVTNYHAPINENDINWGSVNDEMNRLRDVSLDFLKNALILS